MKQSLRTIWGNVSWAAVLILSPVKLNLQRSHCASFSQQLWWLMKWTKSTSLLCLNFTRNQQLWYQQQLGPLCPSASLGRADGSSPGSDILYWLRSWVLFGGGGGYLLPLPAERYWGKGVEICWGTSTNTQSHCGQWLPPRNYKTLTPWKESDDKPRCVLKIRDIHFANKGLYSQSYGFSSIHVWMWELDH